MSVPTNGTNNDESAAGGTPSDPEGKWVRLPRPGFTLRGFSRSFLFQLCAAGTVQSIVIQGPTATGLKRRARKAKTGRGVRLIYLPSLDAFLAAELRTQTASSNARP